MTPAIAPSRMRRGLAHNPFNVRDLSPAHCDYVFPPELPQHDVLPPLSACGWNGELCGPHGSGKSTLLATIRRQLESDGIPTARLFCNDRARTLPPDWPFVLARCRVLLLDGAEAVPRWQLAVLRRAARIMGRGLIMTTHARQGHGAFIAMAASPKVFARLVNERLRTMPGESREMVVARLGSSAADVLRSCGGNAREAVLQYYDACEETARKRN